MIRPTHANKIPVYVQIKEKIMDDIQSGVLKPGEPIMTEHELAERFSVSRATARHAVTELVHKGLLTRHQGRGTFVNKPKIDTKLQSLYSFSQEMLDKGLKPESKIIEFEVVLPKPFVREKLFLEDGELVIKLVRLRLVDNELIMLETTFLPYHLFRELTQEQVEDAQSLYTLLEEIHGVKIVHGVDYLEPVLIDEYSSRMLGVPMNVPALYIERVGNTSDERIVQFTQTVVRGDRCRYFVELFRS